MEVCQTIKSLSGKVWEDLQQAKRQGRKIKEETITDNIMAQIFELPSTKILTKEFTRQEESTEGADWEWWFKGLDDKWFGMRVQAKVIDLDSDKYEHLHYKKKGIYQVDNLISRAEAVDALPVYCLYTYSDQFSIRNAWRCSDYREDVKKYGCSLSTAYEVRTLRNSKIRDLDSLTPFMRPWHCAVCCRIDENDSLSARVRRYWEIALRKKPSASLEPEDAIFKEAFYDWQEIRLPELLKDPPIYIRAIVENQEAKDKIDDDLRYVSIFIEEEPKDKNESN